MTWLARTTTPWRRYLARGVRYAVRRWRASLQLRVVSLTMLLGIVVVSLLGTYLYSEIARGLEEQRVESSKYETRTLTAEAQRQWDNSSPATGVAQLDTNAGDIMQRYLAPAGPIPTRYVVMARGVKNTSTTVIGTLASGELGLSSISASMRAQLGNDPSTQQVQVTEVIVDGDRVPAVVVGSSVLVPSAGYYDLYFIYPMSQERQTMTLISNAFVIAGLALTLLLGVIAFLVTRQVVIPVRRAASVAERLSSGQLNERMASKGQDDLALLATSFNAMADSLQNQIRQLEGLSRVQQRFVSDVSHELRTPLTTIRMASDLIHDARADFTAPVARSAELLEGELDRFEELLADLLEISRFDAGAAALDLEPVDLRHTIERVVEAAEPLARRRGSELIVHTPTSPVRADIDQRRVERILRNLVVNAIEHSEGHPVEVSSAANGSAVAVVIADQGVGLRPGEASMVFNRFWRADPARARTTGGTGLGLSISLEDARLHNGWLQAWGERGVGSRFRLTLPVSPDVQISHSPLPLSPEDDE